MVDYVTLCPSFIYRDGGSLLVAVATRNQLTQPAAGRKRDMALSEFELFKIKKEVASFLDAIRPSPHLRSQLDLAYTLNNQSIIISEIRPDYSDPSAKIEIQAAKVTYVKSRKCWRIYWKHADLKWYSYDPQPEVKNLQAFFKVLKEDAYGCFWG